MLGPSEECQAQPKVASNIPFSMHQRGVNDTDNFCGLKISGSNVKIPCTLSTISILKISSRILDRMH